LKSGLLSPQPFFQDALRSEPLLIEFTIFLEFIPVLAVPPLLDKLDASHTERFTSKVGDMAANRPIPTGLAPFDG